MTGAIAEPRDRQGTAAAPATAPRGWPESPRGDGTKRATGARRDVAPGTTRGPAAAGVAAAMVAKWRLLNNHVKLAWVAFASLPGVLSDQPAHERALRVRAIDAAIAELSAAEEERRHFREQTLGVRLPPAERQRSAAMLDRLRRPVERPPAPPAPAGEAGIVPGANLLVNLRIDHASPQAIAALHLLLRSLPEEAARVEVRSRATAGDAAPGDRCGGP